MKTINMLRVILAFFMMIGLAMAVIPVNAEGTHTETIKWTGQGPANPGCTSTQTALFHFVLTPGGNNTLESGHMTATFSNEQSDNADGVRHGNSNALHFYVFTTGPAWVTAASVTFTYTGNGGNFQFVISDSSCEGLHITPTPLPSPTTTSTANPTETNTPGPTETATAGPTSTSTANPTSTHTAYPTSTSTNVATSTPTPTFWANADVSCTARGAGVRNGKFTVTFKVDSDVDFQETVEVSAGDQPISAISMWQNGAPTGPTTITWAAIYTRSDGKVIAMSSSAPFSQVCGSPITTITPETTMTPGTTQTPEQTLTITNTPAKVTGGPKPTAGADGNYRVATSIPFTRQEAGMVGALASAFLLGLTFLFHRDESL